MESNEDDDASGSGNEFESANLLLNNSTLSIEENEDKPKCLQSVWQNRKNIVTMAMLWTALLSAVVSKSLLASFFPQEVGELCKNWSFTIAWFTVCTEVGSN